MTDVPELLTPQQFSDGTGGKISSTDPRLPLLIAGATAAVRRYCRWHVAPVVTQERVFDGSGGRVLALPTMRLVAVGPVAEARFPGAAAVPLVDGEHFEWSANGELRRLDGRWTVRYRAITVQMEHGFDEAPDLVQIVQQVVAVAASSPLCATTEQAGIYAVKWATTAPGVAGGMSLLDRDMAVLDTYQLPAVPA